MNLNQDNTPKDQPQPNANAAGGKPPRTKIRFEKPKKNKKPSGDGNQSGACSPDTTKESV